MIQRHRLIDEIRKRGFTYRTETQRTQIYKQPGNTHRIAVPRSQLLEEVVVRSTLRQAGYSPTEIESFVESCRQEES